MILHDLCKTEEMISDNLGVVRDYSREGLLLGHLVLGVTRIQEAANDLGISGEPVLLLEHMLLQPSWRGRVWQSTQAHVPRSRGAALGGPA